MINANVCLDPDVCSNYGIFAQYVMNEQHYCSSCLCSSSILWQALACSHMEGNPDQAALVGPQGASLARHNSLGMDQTCELNMALNQGPINIFVNVKIAPWFKTLVGITEELVGINSFSSVLPHILLSDMTLGFPFNLLVLCTSL